MQPIEDQEDSFFVLARALDASIKSERSLWAIVWFKKLTGHPNRVMRRTNGNFRALGGKR